MGFTDEALYIGVICYETDPAAIMISNTGAESDSFVAVFDTFRTQQTGVAFGTNPVGAEYDGQVSGGHIDWNWSTVWEVRTKINDDSWSAEFEIPFSSLRYGRGAEQRWGVNLERVIRRNNEVSYWVPVPRQFTVKRLDLAGEIGGFAVPPKRPQNLKFMPYVLTSVAHEQGVERASGASEEDAGFDIKYSITPSLTLDATYNTDFAQVESDRQQVNLGRFSLFFPETRPFFLENAASFEVNNHGDPRLFFSRRIGIAADGRRLPIDGGVRLSGKVGPATNVGFLHMRAAGDETGARHGEFTVARVKQDLPNRSSLGWIATNRDNGSTAGQTYGLDGAWGIGVNTTVSGFIARTQSAAFADDDYAAALNADYNSPTGAYNLVYQEVGAGFNPEVGFVSRRNYRRLAGLAQRTYVVDDFLRLNEWKSHIRYNGFWDFEGYHESGLLNVGSWMIWKNGADLFGSVSFVHEGVKEPFPVAGNTVLAGEYDYGEMNLGFSTPNTGAWRGGAGFLAGGFYNGNRMGFFRTCTTGRMRP